MLLYQPNSGYFYNSDTLFLYDFIAHCHPKGNLLDVGCGCGILGLLLARDFGIKLTSIEIQSTQSEFAKKNCEINGVKASIINGDFLESSFKNEFDVVVSNPPYYSDRVLKSEDESLKKSRYNESLPLGEFFAKVYKSLKQRGDFFFCYDSKQLGCVLEALNSNKLTPQTIRFIHPKKEKNSTIFMCHAKRDSKAALHIVPPLFVFDGGEFTSEASMVFKKADTHSIKCEI